MTIPKKILICGFPHCGTTILKSVIGHIEEVEEIIHECKEINITSNKKFILCKWPFIENTFFSEKYKDYIKIFIIRNPLFVFSSLNKRFNHNIPDDHSFDNYVNTIKMYIKCKNNNSENIYTIRYEDLFENDFQKLKEIINNIGIKYNNDIFDNSKYKNVSHDLKIRKTTRHDLYRTWQINQPFINNNNISKLDLSELQKIYCIYNSYILQIYPEINSAFFNNFQMYK